MIRQDMKALGEKRSTIRELFEYGKKLKAEFGEDDVFDFSIGNPSIPCPAEISDTLRRLAAEEDPVKLHSYTSSIGDPGARQAIADDLNARYHIGASGEDLYLTAGAAASLAISLNAVCSPSEEVIVLTPCFPEYLVFISHTGAAVRKVPLREPDFQPDIPKIREALNEKTAAIILNSPNNPTGSLLREDSLRELFSLLREKEEEYGREIYVISDEPYRELNYTGMECPFLTELYADTLVCYSYSKSLSLPGERIGYVLVSPRARKRNSLMAALLGAGRSLGFVCAPSIWQFVIRENAGLTSDISLYKANRDLIYEALTEIGYRAVHPDGAFYLFVKVPGGDAVLFSEEAKKEHILVVPSDDFGMKGYVRISYCVDRDMILRSIPAFRKLFTRLSQQAVRLTGGNYA